LSRAFCRVIITSAGAGTGRLEIDLALLNNASYISTTGKAVKDTLLTALVHELGHALAGKQDNVTPLDYKGDNVRFVNQIYKELRLPEQVSYIAYDFNGILHKLNYEYTNGAAHDAARSGNTNMSLAALGASNDLLIGGSSPNILESGDGNDFLFGGGKDDTLNGGAGIDTGVYFGTPLDYDIQKNSHGSWSVRKVRGAKDAGSDTLKDVEFVQFDGGQTYKLAQGGLTFPTDFALAIDTTGSMGSSIGSVKAQASSLIDAVFAGGKNDGRIGIVGFKDATNGEPSQVILITHIHPDHSGGLVVGGQLMFPAAMVYVGKPDIDFWLNPTNAERSPNYQRYINEAIKTVKPYLDGGKLKPFSGETVILPGITAHPTPGHTAGYSFFLVESKGEYRVLGRYCSRRLGSISEVRNHDRI
jgi:hypothetical protein